eukprot:TRINITY_DN1547_c0_g1_i1.p1 TRINITY_DN1547_c0_g1~~TRINITY_DN1547_c0_g1_i1.p1  ORF type:complete len:432 (+),score=94.57 TRINITY_DN1547_c0_g1_i1:47-1297(+)
MQRQTMACLLANLVVLTHGIDNGYGMLPPMGWRSWNCYGGNVNQSLMESVMDRMAERKRTVNGVLTSLTDLGYVSCGLDDNWQQCGAGVNGSFHDSEGNPIINTARFPDMGKMVDHGHAKGLKVGWYMNNCICKEREFKANPQYIAKHMQNSVKALVDFKFDGLKLDDCGEFRNLTWWAQLLNETGRPVMIENCHWGYTVPGQAHGDGPCTGTGIPSDCPYNFFRSSPDIKAFWDSVMFNLQSTRLFQGNPPLSRPGAWAYPDMLEVGRLRTLNEDRSHFGAWCVISAPLILGLDLNKDADVDKVWDIISNKEAIAVNQAWAGHPGKMYGLQLDGLVEIWGKPLENSSAAVFALNNDVMGSRSITLTFSLCGLSPSTPYAIRDIWNHKDLGVHTGSFTTETIGIRDSAFLRFTPSA